MAKRNGIKLAISNPCFEVWLLLHFQHFASTLDRHKVQALLKLHVQGYEKHMNFEDYSPGYQNAVRRAKELRALAESIRDLGRNPSTGVYELTEAIISPPQQNDDDPATSRPDN
jgi:RloB-like protein